MYKVIVATQNSAKMNDFLFIGRKYLAKEHIKFEALANKLNPPKEGTVSLEENALAKARYYSKRLGVPVIADDSGFEVNALHGQPGMFPRRWSESTGETLNQKVLRLLGNTLNRKCTSITSVALVFGKKELVETSSREGTLLYKNKDPKDEGVRGILIPKGANKTLSEMTPEEECDISYCARTECVIKIFERIL